MKKKIEKQDFPTAGQLEKELKRVQYKHRYRSTFRSTFFVLVIVAAIAVLVATLWLPILQIYGDSMSPTVSEGDIVLSVKSPNFDVGDIISFYYNNKLLVKRVIGRPGDWIKIDNDGNVFVNNEQIDESAYLDQSQKSMGECDLIFPYQVPAERYFVLGDHREVSLDSRNSTIGCISKDQIVGKLTFKLWPLNEIRKLG